MLRNESNSHLTTDPLHDSNSTISQFTRRTIPISGVRWWRTSTPGITSFTLGIRVLCTDNLEVFDNEVVIPTIGYPIPPGDVYHVEVGFCIG